MGQADTLHPNLARVTAAARSLGLKIRIERFPEGTRTAEDAARAVGCEVGQIVKSLVFVADGDPVVALVSGANRLDPRKLADAIDATTVRRADGSEARAATGFAIGGVPPFGHARRLPVLMDSDLESHDVVWAAAGLPDAVFAVAPQALRQAIGAPIADLAERTPPE